MTDQLDRLNQVGPEIERRFTAMGLSQAAFASKAGVSDTFLRPLLKSKATSLPRRATLARLSIALGLHPDAMARWLIEAEPLPDPDGPGGPATPAAKTLELAARIGQLDDEARAKVEAMLDDYLPK